MSPRPLIALLVLVSVAFLSWSIACTVGPWGWRAAAASARTATITPLGVDGAPATGAVSVSGIVVDDRFVRRSEVEVVGDWSSEDQWKLTHEAKGTGAPASIGVSGHRLTVGLFQRGDGGRVRIGAGDEHVDVSLVGSWWAPLWVDVPTVAVPWWFAGAVFVLLAAVAGVLQPWRGGRRLLGWLALHLGVVHVVFWGSQTVGSSTDSPWYLAALDSIAAGKVNYFPPGYSLLLAICRLFGDDRLGATVTLVQHAMVVACLLGAFVMLREVLGDTLTFAACLVAGSLGPSLLAPQLAMSESLATFGMGFGVFLVWLARQRRAVWWAVVGGVLIGWGGLARVVPLAAAGPAVVLLCLLPWRERHWRSLWAAAAGGAVVVLPMVGWFWLGSGKPRLTEGVGLHLFNHFVSCQKLLDEQGPATIDVVKACGGRDLRELGHWDVTPRLREAGYDWETSLELVSKVAWEAARTAGPLQHVVFTAGLTWDNLMADAYDANMLHPWTPDRVRWIECAPVLGLHASGLQWATTLRRIHNAAWPVLSWLYIAGCVLGLLLRGRLAVVAIAWLPLGYIAATSCVEYRLHRYNAAVFPFMVVVAAVPFAVAGRAVAASRRS